MFERMLADRTGEADPARGTSGASGAVSAAISGRRGVGRQGDQEGKAKEAAHACCIGRFEELHEARRC